MKHITVGTFCVLYLLCVDFLLADEADEVRRLAPKYEAESGVRLKDGTRPDLLSEEYAIEVEWGEEWAEGIGQCLYYALAAERKPGLILLLKDPEKENRFLERVRAVNEKYDLGIRVWVEIVPDSD